MTAGDVIYAAKGLFMSVLPPRRRQVRAAVRVRDTRLAWWTTAFFILLTLLLVATAQAEGDRPRIGLSASKTIYVDNIIVQPDTEFELYAMVAGYSPGEAMNQPVSSMPWVIHQVCCGALIEILDVKFNPDLQHEGHPLSGTTSFVETCLDQDTIWLATLTVQMVSTQAEDVLWAAGPFGPIVDCDGEVPFFASIPVTITLDGEPTPNEISPWGQVKAMYR